MSLKGSLLLLVLASMLSTADLLRCYACQGEKCTSTPLTCSAGHYSCIKKVYEERGKVIWKEERDCGPQGVCSDKYGYTYNTYCCEGDLCNGAGTIGKNLLLLLVPLASIFVVS